MIRITENHVKRAQAIIDGMICLKGANPNNFTEAARREAAIQFLQAIRENAQTVAKKEMNRKALAYKLRTKWLHDLSTDQLGRVLQRLGQLGMGTREELIARLHRTIWNEEYDNVQHNQSLHSESQDRNRSGV